MSIEIKRKRYKKHIMELKFLRSELAYQEEVLAIAHQDFEIWYRQWCEENGVNLIELNQKHKTRVSKFLSQPNFSDLKNDEQGLVPLTKEKKEEKKKFHQLFKQLAKVTHPDKNEGTILDFKTASSAYQQGDWAMLLQIAEEYQIMPQDLGEVLPVMKEEAKRLRKTIEENKGMYSWKFHECETEQCKENLVKKFLKHLFKVEL
tara:strand:+ start:15 stop:626 length:612 start_codon:yes stop_codon:yes gene_type:complete